MARCLDSIEDLVTLLEAMATAEGELAGLSALDHGVQCATLIETITDSDEELIVAGLVHDIGHHLGGDLDEINDDIRHGSRGAEAVRGLLGDRIADLVEAHVPAKRYLARLEPGYELSAASTVSLERQGGPMTAIEFAAFERAPLAATAVTLRRADEAAKVPGIMTPGRDWWEPLVRRIGATPRT